MTQLSPKTLFILSSSLFFLNAYSMEEDDSPLAQANKLLDQRKYKEAAGALELAAKGPDRKGVEASMSLGLMEYFKFGKSDEAQKHLSRRFEGDTYPPLQKPLDLEALRDGTLDLTGKIVFVRDEKDPSTGIGDRFQFAVVFKKLKDAGAHVVLACDKKFLATVLSHGKFVDEVNTGEEKDFDHDAYFFSLVFNMPYSDLCQMSHEVGPFIDPFGPSVDEYTKRFKRVGGRPFIFSHRTAGLPVLGGRMLYKDIPLAELAELFAIPGTAWYDAEIPKNAPMTRDEFDSSEDEGKSELNVLPEGYVCEELSDDTSSSPFSASAVRRIFRFGGTFDRTNGAFVDTIAVAIAASRLGGLAIGPDSAPYHTWGSSGASAVLMMKRPIDVRYRDDDRSASWNPVRVISAAVARARGEDEAIMRDSDFYPTAQECVQQASDSWRPAIGLLRSYISGRMEKE